MAITSHTYASGVQALLSQYVDISGTNMRCALFKSSYTPDYAHDLDYVDLRNAHEVETTNFSYDPANPGYFQLGALVGARTISTVDNVVQVTAQETHWLGLNTTFRYAIVFWQIDGSASSPMFGAVDFGEDVTVTTPDTDEYAIQFPDGFLNVTIG